MESLGPRAMTGHEILAGDVEFQWPYAQSIDGGPVNLSLPFMRGGAGFLACVLVNSRRENAFGIDHNRRLQPVAGYSFDPKLFPWIVL